MAERRGRPRVERDPNERIAMSTRVRGELFNKLSQAAQRNDRPLGNEVELRLEASFRDEQMLDETFSLAFGERAGLARLVCDAIRRGGGSAAITELLKHVKVPDETSQPAMMVRQMISDLGYRGDSRLNLPTDHDAQLRRRYGGPLMDQLEQADREINGPHGGDK
jgi:hypothetical protein